MVHKKYIKRGNKVFGPYLYRNYRENGVVKTKYLGLADKSKRVSKESGRKDRSGKKTGRKIKKSLWANKSLLIIVVILVLVFSLGGLFLFEKDVFKTDELKGKLAAEKSFDVFVRLLDNDPPVIIGIPNEILVCENTRLEHFFNVSDEDVDSLEVTISPLDPFFVRLERKINDFLAEYKIWSGTLDKRDVNKERSGNEGWATYFETIKAEDNYGAYALSNTKVVIIEVNNPPEFDIGVQTIWTQGDDRVFYYDLGAFLRANLEETPTTDLIFNLTYEDGLISPFDISSLGIINIAGNESLVDIGNISKVYDLRVCVNDTGLQTIPHQNISMCLWNDPPQDREPKGWCDDFSLTVTKENRKPIITSHYPINLSLNVMGTELLDFNITDYDPDWTIPDTYWYVDGVEEEYDESSSFDEFKYVFGCGISGQHNVTVVATDGLLNDSIQWNLSVGYRRCPSPGVPGTTGGAGGGLYCREEWGCGEWQQCENLKQASELEEPGISKEYELLIEKRCGLFNYSEDVCGFQTRECTDFNYCRTNYSRPGIIKECYYTEHPNCTDRIKNCHNGSCEVLVDCGGPCPACPTCSDGIKNQGEERIDCGGPCRPCVEIPFRPILFKSIISYSLIALLILVLVLVVRQIVKYSKYKEISRKKIVEDKARKKPVKRKYLAEFVFLFITVALLFFANIYIMNLTQRDRIVLDVGKEGFLRSQGVINNIMRGFANIFLINVAESIIGTNADLIVWDDTDDVGIRKYTKGILYGKTDADWNVYFYANYTNKTGEAISPANGNGACDIRFNETGSWETWGMNFNSVSLFWEYNRSFDYKGELDFEVDCTSSYENLNLLTNIEITNTPPQIDLTLPTLEFDEDVYSNFDFSQRVSEDDKNDKLAYSIRNISGLDPSLYDWITINNSGSIFVNATHEDQTGSFDLGIEVVDSDPAAVSRIQTITINPVNDAPVFVNLENQTLLSEDLFEYIIEVADEENNFPFKFNISFMSCSNLIRENCTLFTKVQYSVDEVIGEIDLSFIPAENDIGSYIINFSVMDNSSLGNQTTSKIVNFSVEVPIWDKDLVLDYLLTEDEEFYLNLSESVVQENVVFSYADGFNSFDLTSEGIINFTPIDEDVGYNVAEITASNIETSSPKIFNFTVQNINDDLYIQRPLQANGVISVDAASNIEAYENADIEIFLLVDDDDLLIPAEQKSFYDEILDVNLTIEGPNTTLFEFVFDSGFVSPGVAKYDGFFIPRDLDLGSYSITINVTDKSNSSDVLNFNLTIYNRDYDTPVINFPNSSYEFNLKENVTSDLIFRANHTIGDDLNYKFYINDDLRYNIFYPGDNSDLIWSFAPNFTDETYGEVKNLTLVVLNPFFPDLNASRTWNLTVDHTNAPVEFIKEIGDKILPYDYSLQIDLKDHFLDIDHEDSYYRQNVSFFVSSNSSPSYINVGPVSEDWTFVLSSSKYASFFEVLNITAVDLNETNGNVSNMTSAVSNNFIIEFIPPKIVTIPVPQPVSGGGGGGETIISLKIIMPGQVSVYEYEKIEIPIQLVNSGKKSFSGLSLSSTAFKDGDITEEVRTSLDKTYFKSLGVGKKENLTLTVFFNTDKIGDYEVLVNVTTRSPKYADWGKIHINLQRINESEVRELLVFTEEFIVQNPACIEIKEIVDEAKIYFEEGDFPAAREKARQAITACEESISQAALPKKREKIFGITLYLALAILFAFIMGIIYYFIKRRRLQAIKSIGV